MLDAGKAKSILSGLKRKNIEAIRDSAGKSVAHYTRYKDAFLLRIVKSFLDGATSLVGREQVPDSDAEVSTADLIERYFSDMKAFWKNTRSILPEGAQKTAQSVTFRARTNFNYEDTQSRSDLKKGNDLMSTTARRMMAQYPKEFQRRVKDIRSEWVGDDRFDVVILFK